MLFPVLALTAALGAHTMLTPLATPVAAPATAAVTADITHAFVVDCQVSGDALTDCKVMDADPQVDARAATALKLAAEIHLPSGMAVSNPGRIKIRLNVNP